MNLARRYRYPINIVLALAAAGTMVFYAFCTTSCSYLQGDLLGLDLKYAGIIFMAAVIALTLLKKDLLLSLLLSLGVGGEIFLVSFQVRNNVYCPYCLAFGSILLILFLLNIHPRKKLVMLLFIAAGLAATILFFRGSAVPSYGVPGA